MAEIVGDSLLMASDAHRASCRARTFSTTAATDLRLSSLKNAPSTDSNSTVEGVG